MDVDEPLTNVAVPSLNVFISDAILADAAVKEPLIPTLVNVLIVAALAPNEPLIAEAVNEPPQPPQPVPAFKA